MNRAGTWAGVTFSAIALVACRQAAEEGEDFKGDLVTEADSTYCGGRENIHTNYTNFSQTLHIKVANNCTTLPEDSLGMAGSAILRILDEQGQVVNRQEMRVLANSNERGTFSVPGKGRVELECGRPRTDHGKCNWTYSYSP